MTLTEVLVILLVVAGLFVLILSSLQSAKRHASKVSCWSQERTIYVCFEIWAGEHGDKYPMQLGSAEGGAKELAAIGNVAAIFRVMSNELWSPKVLICPEDTIHHYAPDFTTNFGRKNISYFVGLDATEENTNSILVGDDNLVIDGVPAKSGVFELFSNTPVAWTSERHHSGGYIVLAGGWGSIPTNLTLARAIIKQYEGPSGFTNRFRIAIP